MTAHQRLGQHFLTDRNILRRIVDALEPARGEAVLEIGPGRGSLTEELLARGLRVIAIEKDPRLAAELGSRVSGTGCRVVTGDALKLDWHELFTRYQIPDTRYRFTIVGNIPYNITSPLLEKALTPPLPERVVFLVQEEVADRVVAEPGSKVYGALTIGLRAVCAVEKLFVVRAGAFAPPPNVHSAVLRLRPLAEPLIDPQGEGAAFRRFVTACFTRRRKQLRNVVAGATERPAGEVAAALTALGLDPRARPETLAPGDFVRLLRWSRAM